MTTDPVAALVARIRELEADRDAKHWPPPEGVNSVIAEVGGCWIEMNRDPASRFAIERDFHPVILNSHGCGCCSGDDPTPTRWVAVPVG